VFCTGISQQIRGFSGDFPHVLHNDFDRSAVPHFRNVFAAIPEELAGSAGEKNGEKRAWKASCGKVCRSP
jgi:hypothetical protein